LAGVRDVYASFIDLTDEEIQIVEQATASSAEKRPDEVDPQR
jgi:hypothetical protein